MLKVERRDPVVAADKRTAAPRSAAGGVFSSFLALRSSPIVYTFDGTSRYGKLLNNFEVQDPSISVFDVSVPPS